MKDWFVYTLFTIFVWGLWGLFSKLAVDEAEARFVLLFQAVGMFVFSIVAVSIMRFSVPWSSRGFTYGVLAGLTAFAGYFTFFLALERGKASVIVPLAAMGPVFTVVLSIILLHERPTLRQSVGIALAVLACIVIAA
ncbi:MAG: EamA family transporter [Candidatus Acidiferrales bacterium]